jgi:3-oxoadipate enol-lactonase
MPTGIAQVNGTQLHYETAGVGPPVVLIHGGLVNHRMWDDQFVNFASKYRVVRYDLRGYGRSSPPDQPYTHHEDLKALLDFLGIGSASLIGQALGGSIAVDLALAFPSRVVSLVLVSSGLGGAHPPDVIEQQWQTLEEAYSEGNKSLVLEQAMQLWVNGPRRSYEQMNPLVYERLRAMIQDVIARPEIEHVFRQRLIPLAGRRLGELKLPALILHGDQDLPHILQSAEKLQAGIAEAGRVTIASAGHFLNMEQPGQFNELVLEFLNDVYLKRSQTVVL